MTRSGMSLEELRIVEGQGQSSEVITPSEELNRINDIGTAATLSPFQFWPPLPRGNILGKCSRWRCSRSIVMEMRRVQDFYFFVSERAEVLPRASTELLQIIKSKVTSHFQYITPQFVLTPPLWLHRPQTGQHCRHQTEPWRSGRSAGSWKHLHFPCHCAAGERYPTWVRRHLLSVQVSQPSPEIEHGNSCHLFN